MKGTFAQTGLRCLGAIQRCRTNCLAAFVAAGAIATASAADVLYVDASSGAGGDGQSWDTAYRFLQDALEAAPTVGMTEIRIAQGVYLADRSNETPAGSGDRSASFHMANGVVIRGGYAGTPGIDPDERDIELYTTILSGDLLGNDGPEFANNAENSYTVVTAAGVDSTARLDGVTVSGGNANSNVTNPGPENLGGGLLIVGGDPAIIDCRFYSNHARSGGGTYIQGGNPLISDCGYSNNSAVSRGGAIRPFLDSAPHVNSCTFENNVAESGGAIAVGDESDTFIKSCTFRANTANIAGAIYALNACLVSLENCVFEDNVAGTAAGAILLSEQCVIEIGQCIFHNNDGGMLGGGIVGISSDSLVVDCVFTSNSAISFGGAVIEGGDLGGATYINTVFAQNVAEFGSAVFVSDPWFSVNDVSRFVNCTFAQNYGYMVSFDFEPSQVGQPMFEFTNCIVWDNSPAHFSANFEPYVVLIHSNISGGWNGSGGNNIDSNPLFVQPLNLNYRLTHGSPCVNAGDNDEVPKGIETDLAGMPRIQDKIVDMGAYEGEYDPEAAYAYASGIDQGEFRVLVPYGTPHNPIDYAAIVFWNDSGPDNAWALVTQYESEQHLGAGGYDTFNSTLSLETSLLNGDLYARVFVPFTLDDLDGADPLDVEMTTYNAGTNNWRLAVKNNTANSPGHSSPIGDRHVQVGGQWNVSPDLGDYGVFWNPDLERGFAWAVVDHAADFRLGLLGCVGDLNANQDVAADDLFVLLQAWSSFGGPADLNDDGVVNVTDLLLLLGNWGPCK